MTAKHIRSWVVGGTIVALSLFGGSVDASSYPPDDPTPSTVAVGGVSGVADPAGASPTSLAATGSESDTTVKVAGAAIVAGVGLLMAARQRRRPA